MISRIKNYINDDIFRLELFNDKVHVINYLEIIILDSKKMSFLIPSGKLYIRGNNLMLKRLLDREILVMGNVISIEVDKDE